MVTQLGGYEDDKNSKGSALREVTTSEGPGDKGLLDTTVPPCICEQNSSTTTLGADETFTGTAFQTNGYGIIYVSVFSDVASATDGLVIEQSPDGTNWDHSDNFTIPANTGKNFSINPFAKFYRVKYTNGGSSQSEFRLQSILKSIGKSSSHRIQDAISTDDDAELVKSVLTGQDEEGTFQNVKTTKDGNLTISDNSDGLAIAKGDVTGHTFIHKFGQAPDFDIGDGFVTVWDGADDSRGALQLMNYVFSTTADIAEMASSDNGDTVDVEVQGLDADYNLVTQTKTLTGQTPVTLDTALIRVFRMKNVGSTDLVGNVTLATTGASWTGGQVTVGTANTQRAFLQNGNNQTLMAVYTIPAGKTGYVRDWYASQANESGGFFSTDGSCTIKLKARPFGQVFQIKHISSIKSDGTSYIQHKYEEPEKFTEKTDIIMESNTSVDGAAVSAGFDIVLVDN